MKRFKDVLACVALVVVTSLVGAKNTLASTDIGTLITEVQYQYNPPEFAVCVDGKVNCTNVDKKDEFTLIHADGGPRCPAGYYFIANQKQKEIEPVIAPTCDPSLKIKFASNSRSIELALFGKVSGTVPLDR